MLMDIFFKVGQLKFVEEFGNTLMMLWWTEVGVGQDEELMTASLNM